MSIRKDMEMLLLERFPTLFKHLHSTPFESCMGRGIECWEGWYDLIWECSKELEAIHPDIEYTQIKEKLARLTIYVDYPKGEDGKVDEEDYRTINAILDKYRTLSQKVCEGCGTTQNVALRNNGWLFTFCNSCNYKWLKHRWQALDMQFQEDEM